MTVTAIIPVKRFAEGKARLADILSNEARESLCRRLFTHVLDTVCAARGIDAVIAVGGDEEVAVIARARGADHLADAPEGGLNAALDLGRRQAVGRLADTILIVPADLAFLAPADVEAMLAVSGPPRACAIAPDEAGDGTNALLLAPPDLIAFSFGSGSFAAHCAAAENAGLEPAVVERPGLAFDLDEPDELSRVAGRFPLF